ncbi:hypothetical protein [Sphingorhabdus sp. 109]|uniref:hypothetical protein n=1 Tax=Sphingorhabdus sp. 109 TaxID=2653173 RepID=UPI0012F4422F|nr:hypothetical protein [Sphingorhabdus sp. 109]VWX62528.1 conserved hypothetical protein [Sphingorhabdus sp. 109]
MSAAELTSGVDAPKGKKKPKGHPWDWHVEPPWVVQALIDALPVNYFDGQVVYDPCCGLGTIPTVFANPNRYEVIGSDRYQRADHRFPFFKSDFRTLSAEDIIFSAGFNREAVSIVSNFPYSKQAGKLERGLAAELCRKSLEVATHKVCALLPLKWLAGEGKHRFLTEFPARFYIVLNERPSMPPGNKIEQLGAKAFKRGKVDYMWVVWDKQVTTLPGETRVIHIAPRPKEERG